MRPLGSRRAVDELPEPELQHDQLPQAVAGIRPAVTVFRPQARHLAVVEDAALTQPSIAEQAVGHRRQWTAQPLADRRLEATLAALQDLAGNAAIERSAQQVFAAAVLDLQ